jgi:hypothetical protein
MIFKTGKSFDGLTYKFKVKENKTWVYDINHKLIEIFDNAKKASIYFNIPSSTLYDYIKSGKLYKNKYYFYKNQFIKNRSGLGG